jgi:gliding motility-associated-like protein
LWEQLSNISGLNLDDPTAVQTTVMPEPDSNEVYTILLTATSADGCQDTATVQIRVNIETLLGMPDAFTPNGDGFNDYFRPAGLDDQFILAFKIYNRWGQVVFDGINTSSNWDGTFLGVNQPSEVYIYLAVSIAWAGTDGYERRNDLDTIILSYLTYYNYSYRQMLIYSNT